MNQKTPNPSAFRILDSPPDPYTGPYVTLGTKAHWVAFAHWHFRGPPIGPIRKILVLHNRFRPIGICVLGFGPLVCRPRNLVFAIHARLTTQHATWVNRNFTRALRLVIAPRSRHHGYGPALLRTAARAAPTPWVERVSPHPAVATWATAAAFHLRRGRAAARSRAKP